MGTYHWVAIYNGDANNTTVSSACAAEPVTITQATPAISTTPSAGRAGRHVHLGHGDGDAAGSSRRARSPSTCSRRRTPTCTGTPVFTSTNPLSGSPLSATSGPLFATTGVGTYHWVAIYNGDANNTTVSSGLRGRAGDHHPGHPDHHDHPSTGGPVGTSISDTATVSGGFNPTGTVTFNLFPPTDTTCTGTPVFTSPTVRSAGAAPPPPLPSPTTTVGTYHWVAIYNGDANNTTVSSGCAAEPVAITQATPTIATTPSAGGPVGTSIIDTATVTGGLQPHGHGHLRAVPAGGPTCTGTPVFTSTGTLDRGQRHLRHPFATTAVGTYHWGATYSGDANNTGTRQPRLRGRAGDHHQGRPDHRRPRPSPGGPVGTSISDTATVSGGFNPTGTVTFDLFPPTDTTCTGTPVFTSPNSPLSGGSATSAPPFADHRGGHLPLGGHLQR